MKFTTCDVGKLFLLLTAFFLLDSPGYFCQCTAEQKTITKELLLRPINKSFSSNNKSKIRSIKHYKNNILFPIKTKIPLKSNTDAEQEIAKTIKEISPIKTTLISKRETKKQISETQSNLKRNKRSSLNTNPNTSATRQQKSSYQRKSDHLQNVAVVMPSQILDRVQVQEGFLNFVEFFQVGLKNVKVDFIRDSDLSGFIKLLEHPKYTTVVKILNTWINVNDDLDEGVFLHKDWMSTSYSNPLLSKRKQEDTHRGSLKNYTVTTANTNGACCLEKEIFSEFNKTVLMWPCPHMKESRRDFLPSFEAISFAMKSIAAKLNWTEVDIFVGEDNWGLALAIASNLNVPYSVRIGQNSSDLTSQDKPGKAIIITSAITDESTLRLLSQLKSLKHTKVLLVDIVAASLNTKNMFYKHLTDISSHSYLLSNLLLLTVLSDKYRYFLNVAYEDYDMKLVQDFRQTRRWRNQIFNRFNGNIRNHEAQNSEELSKWWPVHIHNSIARILEGMTNNEMLPNGTASNLIVNALSICLQAVQHKLNEICQNTDEILLDCEKLKYLKGKNFTNRDEETQNLLSQEQVWTLKNFYSKELVVELASSIKEQCRLGYLPTSNNSATEKKEYEEKVLSLRNFIDFFNFYDFLIANLGKSNIRNSSNNADNNTTNSSAQPEQKYDFIVLDIVQGNGSVIEDSNGQNARAMNTSSRESAKENTYTSQGASTNNGTYKWRPLLILEQHEIHLNTYITHSIQPGYDNWLLVRTVQLWQCGAICWTIIAICAGVLLIVIAASVAAGIALRNYLLRKRLSKGPNKIVLSPNDFVFPVDSRRVDEGIEAMLCCWLQQLQEFGGPEVDKPDLLKGSIGSLKNLGLLMPGGGVTAGLGTGVNSAAAANGKPGSGSGSLARHNPNFLDMRARYNGDLVQLKEIPLNGSTELKSKAMDLMVMAHGLRHENINPLIGWLSDPNRTAMVFDYCSRGSLQDVLIMDEIKLDWSFRLSLLTDLVRGMRYLHSSPLRVHGALTSRNCVVDARWVLKITDYVLPTFYEAQGVSPPSRNAKELLWTSPELLRSMKPNQHHHHSRALATQMGDVYSFGIIMQEVVVRGEPYCMLSLSAEEIILKIKKPPPLIRPSVSKGAAPPEAINIMRQCWAEQPEMRPDFNSVYERFKVLNHGRKVNFVDTMFQMLEKYSNNLEELIRERTEQLDIERKKTEQLLNRMLPSSVAEKLKMGLAVDPEEFSDVTIYFSDIVGFTTIAAHCSPVQVVDLLNDLYTIFDATINAYNVYKVETIGDAYMVVSGLPVKIPDHAEQIATMALDLLHQSGRFNLKHLPGVPLQLRIGLHTGPCCAGVVGLTMPRYCLFGDTVNTASRMESTGSSWRIHMSQETRDRLEARGGYMIEPRGLIEIKGKGLMNTFWLLGKKGFDKPLPTPPPIGESHGLDESLIRNSITMKAQANKSRNSTNPSSSQSSSLAGESVEVKVEITPPTNVDMYSTNLPNSYSLDSNSTTTISPNTTLCPEFPTKTPSASPQSRKMSELAPENLLNPGNFNRLPNSTGGSSSRLYKKIEEMMDLSLPYNHYKCLSPSESNLTQFYDGKYLYCNNSGGGMSGGSAGCSTHSSSTKFDSKPGSSRLLRRQFSLDRDDPQSKGDHHHHQHHQSSLQATYTLALSNKSSLLDIPILHDTTSRSPKGTLTRAHKQNSTSITQDLEKIEEIPLSPVSSQQHSSMDSNLNRSPPSTVDGHSPPPYHQTEVIASPHHLCSAPTSPSDFRPINDTGGTTSLVVENSTTTDCSTATSATTESANSTPIEKSNIRRSEITLNAGALLSR